MTTGSFIILFPTPSPCIYSRSDPLPRLPSYTHTSCCSPTGRKQSKTPPPVVACCLWLFFYPRTHVRLFTIADACIFSFLFFLLPRSGAPSQNRRQQYLLGIGWKGSVTGWENENLHLAGEGGRGAGGGVVGAEIWTRDTAGNAARQARAQLVGRAPQLAKGCYYSHLRGTEREHVVQ